MNRERSVFYIIDWPERWRRFYFESGLIDRDPLLEELKTRFEPFTWTDLRRDNKLSRLGRQVLDRTAAEGWTEGLVVPVTRGEKRVGLVSLVGRSRSLTQSELAFLTLISMCLHCHVRTLVVREGFAAPPAGLTPREVEAVGRVAQGLSDKAIAQAMGIAEATAHEFVEKAKRRLKANSRAELAAVAAALGIVDI